MDFELSRSTILALILGRTEFHPISSSVHLILPSELFGWDDQGLGHMENEPAHRARANACNRNVAAGSYDDCCVVLWTETRHCCAILVAVVGADHCGDELAQIIDPLAMPDINWNELVYATVVAALTAFFCIHYFLKLIATFSFMQFVVYRLLL